MSLPLAYLLPNDESETERLDVYHYLMNILNGGLLHRAPLQDPQRILDIGTGAGNWAIDMGEKPATNERVVLIAL